MTRRLLPTARLRGAFAPDGGLDAESVTARRQRYGANDIVEVAESPWLRLLRDTAGDPMIWFLLGTSVLYSLLGDSVEAVVLLIATLPLVGMDLLLHRRTQASTAGLRSHLASQARVRRSNADIRIPAADVVPGDLVAVGAGDAFPADGVIVDAVDLQVEEAALTGESFPVRKHALAALASDEDDLAVADENWGFAGTRVLTGEALVRIVYTGGETLYGEIVRSARGGDHQRTPLQVAIANLVRVLVVAAAVACIMLASVRIYQGYGWADALVTALTLAVAALPEEFPVVFTFFLGVGVYRLARRKALVRRAVSVENVGRVTCICTDKTGTITAGRLELTHLVPADGIGEARLLALASIASRRDGDDPLDAAIGRGAEAAGHTIPVWEEIERVPFSEDSRRESAVVRAALDGPTEVLATIKGSVEIVLELAHLAAGERTYWQERADRLAAEGHKVIACAWQPLDGDGGSLPAHGYRFVGLLAFEDPVRDGAAEAIATCRDAGIHTVMVTGDHPLTATAVAREIGLGGSDPRVLTAQATEELLATGRAAELRGIDVIARAIPAQKLGIVRALQGIGEVVAVTGDGVNDVPALQAADVGIAMGERGTRSAREIASIVLLDDNFRTIVGAIAEGRQLFGNLRRSFAYLLMIHVPLVVTAALVPLLGHPVLYKPIHIVWLELIIHPTALLVFQDLAALDRLGETRRRRETGFFSPPQWASILAVGGGLTLLILLLHQYSGGVDHGRALALAVLAASSGLLTILLSGLRTATSRWIAFATVALSAALIQIGPLAAWLHLKPLHPSDWMLVAGGVLLCHLPLLPWLGVRSNPGAATR
jgi:Ca2+-transporting ATPase